MKKIIVEDKFGWPIEVEGRPLAEQASGRFERFDKVIKYRGYTICVVAGIPSARPFEYGIRKEVYLYDPAGNEIKPPEVRRTIAIAKMEVDRLLAAPKETFIMSKDGESYRHSGTEKQIKKLERAGWVITDRKKLDKKLDEDTSLEAVAEANKSATQPAGKRENSVLRFRYDALVWRKFSGEARITVKLDEAALEQLKSEALAESNAEIEKIKRDRSSSPDEKGRWIQEEMDRSKAEIESLDSEIRSEAAIIPHIRVSTVRRNSAGVGSRISIDDHRCQQVFINGELVRDGDELPIVYGDDKLELIESSDPLEETFEGSNL